MRLTQVLDYIPNKGMRAIVKEERNLTALVLEAIPDMVADVEEPTAAMFVALAHGLLAREDREGARKAARTAIRMSQGDRHCLITVFALMYKADEIDVAKQAVAAMDRPEVAQLADIPIVKPIVKKPWWVRSRD